MKVFEPFRLDTVNHCLWRADVVLPPSGCESRAYANVCENLMEHRPVFIRLNEFIERNRYRMPNRENNLFTMAFSQCSRYYYWLEIIEIRYNQASRDFVENAQRTLADPSSYNHTYSDLSHQLQLEIESFYIFAKIFLDRVADAYAFFFDFRWGGRGSTFSKLAEKYEGQRNFRKHLPDLSNDLRRLIAELKRLVVEHKTDVIEHNQEPGVAHSTTYTLDGKTRIMPINIYDIDRMMKCHEQQTHTPDEIFQTIDIFVDTFLTFIQVHVDRSPLISSASE